jgi:hypothetical protein
MGIMYSLPSYNYHELTNRIKYDNLKYLEAHYFHLFKL